MAILVPAWLPAGPEASFDVMRVSTFPGGSSAARLHPLNGQESPAEPRIGAAIFDGSF
jgi:hypothetical protein